MGDDRFPLIGIADIIIRTVPADFGLNKILAFVVVDRLLLVIDSRHNLYLLKVHSNMNKNDSMEDISTSIHYYYIYSNLREIKKK